MQNFSTSDMWQAAFLLTRGYRLIDADRSDPKRIAFVFAETPTERDLSEFRTGTALVHLSGLIGAWKKIKRIVYEGQRP